MIFLTDTQELFTDDGQFIKRMECPLATRLAREISLAQATKEFHCSECGVKVLNLRYLTDAQALKQSRAAPQTCFFATPEAENVVHVVRPREMHWYTAQVMRDSMKSHPEKSWPIIRTARSEEEMNFALTNGYQLLFRRTEASKEVKTQKLQLDLKENRISIISDVRMAWGNDAGDQLVDVIPWGSHKISGTTSPFSAYLIPSELLIGETVFVEDLAEHLTVNMPQENVERLTGWWAEWTGTDLKFKPFNPPSVLG